MTPPETGRTALVLGAAGFLGRAITLCLAGRGYSCFLVDHDEVSLREAAGQHAPGLPYAVADVASRASLETAMSQALAKLSRFDAVVLAFGAEGPVGPLEDLDEEAFDEIMAINAKGVFLALKLCLPVMKHQRSGSIVALGSISATMAAPLMAAYAASKHAVAGLVRTAAREAAEFGVRVNAVCPGPVESDMMRRIDHGLDAHSPGRRPGSRNAAASIPMRRYATGDDVARMVAFLCSDDSSYSTGLTLMVDGGYTCR